tara:strand:+ start:3052 stop:3891 length:840 start_codon:yes stop_codon:yes gene_type:complete
MLNNNQEIKKGLYLVSTPIGNLRDITFRAIDILKNSDFILCEDTRISKVLLNKYNIGAKLIAYHKFNEKKNLPKVLELLDKGLIVSLISDAGTPCISDPGIILVNECIERNIQIFPIPGPSSVISAVSISGFSDQFFFYGFFPEKKNLIEDLKKLAELNISIVFFVSSKKIKKIFTYLKNYFTDRKILICKEMTKYYEEFINTEINELNLKKLELKGELTIVISEKKDYKRINQTLSETDKKIITRLINKLSVKEIVGIISENKKISKKEIYNYCIKIK